MADADTDHLRLAACRERVAALHLDFDYVYNPVVRLRLSLGLSTGAAGKPPGPPDSGRGEELRA